MRTERVLAAVLLASGTAHANAPAPYSRPTGAVPGVVTLRASPLAVEREDLVIDCAGAVHPTCTFTATYALHNPSANEEEVLGAFYNFGPGPIAIAHDGVDARTEATPEQLAQMDALVRQDPFADSGRTVKREAFHVVVAGGARARLVFRGEVAPITYEGTEARGYEFSAIETRHPLVGTTRRDAASSDEEFLYLASPLATWPGDPEIHVTIRHDGGAEFSASSPRTAFRTTHEGGRVVERTVMRASARENLDFRLHHDVPSVWQGGPTAALGLRFGREELRARFGWEVGLGRTFVLGASAETNFDAYVTPAALLEAATPSFAFVVPSLALGLGVPVQIRRDTATRVGVRTQITLSWPFVSFLFPIDVYPAESSSGSRVEGSFLGQVSF